MLTRTGLHRTVVVVAQRHHRKLLKLKEKLQKEGHKSSRKPTRKSWRTWWKRIRRRRSAEEAVRPLAQGIARDLRAGFPLRQGSTKKIVPHASARPL